MKSSATAAAADITRSRIRFPPTASSPFGEPPNRELVPPATIAAVTRREFSRTFRSIRAIGCAECRILRDSDADHRCRRPQPLLHAFEDESRKLFARGDELSVGEF